MRQAASNQRKGKNSGLFGQGKPRGVAAFPKEIGAPVAVPSALGQMLAFVYDRGFRPVSAPVGQTDFHFLTGNKTDWTKKCDRIAFKQWDFISSGKNGISA
jgi:hypothetical protein